MSHIQRPDFGFNAINWLQLQFNWIAFKWFKWLLITVNNCVNIVSLRGLNEDNVLSYDCQCYECYESQSLTETFKCIYSWFWFTFITIGFWFDFKFNSDCNPIAINLFVLLFNSFYLYFQNKSIYLTKTYLFLQN